MAHGHDRAERAEQRRSLLSGHVARPPRLVHAQELGREGGVEVLVGVPNEAALVELLGKRGPALLVVLLPEVGHEVAHRIEPPTVLRVKRWHGGSAVEEHEEVVGLHGAVAVDAVHDHAALARIALIASALVVQRVHPNVLRCDAPRRQISERIDSKERERQIYWPGGVHVVQRELHVEVPGIEKNGESSR